MPELPDILLYIHALGPRVVGRRLESIRLVAPFLLRSIGTPLSEAQGRRVLALERMGKRVIFALEGGIFLVVHLMIAGRFRWKPPGAPVPGKVGLLALDFEHGTLVLTEAGSKRRASLHVVSGEDALRALDPGGLEVLDADLRGLLGRASPGEPHAEAGADRSARVERHRQRLLRRDPARRAAVAVQADAVADRRGDGAACSTPRARRCWRGRDGCRTRPATSFPRRSRPSARAWPCTAATGSRARCAARRCSASSTPRTKPTTAPPARPAAGCSPTGRCRACCKEDWPRTLEELERRRTRLSSH